VRHIGDKTQFEVGYQLTSPLQTYSVLFGGIQPVPGVGTLMVPTNAGDVLGLANSRVKGAKDNVLFRDGSEMHFDEAARLVFRTEGSYATAYDWENGRLRAIRGFYRGQERGTDRVDIQPAGLLETAHSSTGKTASYRYDDSGCAVWVQASPVASIGTPAGQLVEMRREGKPVRSFEYDGQGRMTRERRDGAELNYSVQRSPDGVTTISSANETARYDVAMRPLSHTLADGTSIQFRHRRRRRSGRRSESASWRPHEIRWSDSGKQEEWRLPEGGLYKTEFDDAGRPVSISVGDRLAVRRPIRPVRPPGIDGDGNLPRPAGVRSRRSAGRVTDQPARTEGSLGPIRL